MVLGLRNKNRRSPLVQVDYLLHIQEVKPWPPSQSLRNIRSVLIQWEHGDRHSGATSAVVPSLGSGVGNGRIEFNESFRLSTTLQRDMSVKAGDSDTFLKNCVEFNLYEPRRDKIVKGQLLGTAILDLADYGVVKEAVSISVPMNCTRSFRNTAQLALVVKIQPIEKGRTSSSPRDSLSKEASMDRKGGEYVSALMNEEYAKEAEIASFTDDDVSSHSSLAASSSAFDTNSGSSAFSENGPHELKGRKDSPGEANSLHHLTSTVELAKSDAKPLTEPNGNLKAISSCLSSPDVADVESLQNGHAYEDKTEDINITRSGETNNLEVVDKKVITDGGVVAGNVPERSKQCNNDAPSNKVMPSDRMEDEKLNGALSVESQVGQEDSENGCTSRVKAMHQISRADVGYNVYMEGVYRKEVHQEGQEAPIEHEREHSVEDEPWNRCSEDDYGKQVALVFHTLSSNGDTNEIKSHISNNDRLKHVKSVRSSVDLGRSNGSVRINKLGDVQKCNLSNERKDIQVYLKDTRNSTSNSKIQQLEHRIKMLEGELKEAAALEASLYSVVAEHGSSQSKVHAPARRLSRLYFHACKENSQSGRGSTARSAVSGLVLVAKACGDDVPRLTFWLSNSIALRAIIAEALAEKQLSFSAGPLIEKSGVENGNHKKLSPLKWKESSPSKELKTIISGSLEDWEDPRTLISALEKIEAWIFSRIIESVWWQTLTPHMQPATIKVINTIMASDMNTYRGTTSSGDQEQVNFSIELWKKAFKDACERLCPLRAGGHECGCLPVLARLIMEQCVARLDVAMFNAILRESDDELPTDPVSDPISDASVLPIPSGKASFGAGAQLKNAIGNWSRWLTSLFGIDEDDQLKHQNNPGDNDDDQNDENDTSFKSFHLLNALSDLMMLPKDMLISRSIRKEVCPTFGALLIKRVLNNFAPDEFCPDPIPEVVLDALDHKDPLETEQGAITNFPCSAAPVVYLPPSSASIAGIVGVIGSQSKLIRSGSSVLRKSYASDDDLDELHSPLSAIIGGSQTSPTLGKPCWILRGNGSQGDIRYQLLRQVWINGE